LFGVWDNDLIEVSFQKEEASLKDDVLQRWKAQSSNGRLTWKDAAGQDFAIGVSSSGLGQALDAFSKEQ
jgi:hypothetical protein